MEPNRNSTSNPLNLQHSFGAPVSLIEGIAKLGQTPDNVGELLRKIKRVKDSHINVEKFETQLQNAKKNMRFSSSTPFLQYPEQLLKYEGSIKQFKDIPLNNKHPLFANIHEAISRLNELQFDTNEERNAAYQLIEEYHLFIKRVCETSGNDRLALLVGSIRSNLLDYPEQMLNYQGSIKQIKQATLTPQDSLFEQIHDRKRLLNKMLEGATTEESPTLQRLVEVYDLYINSVCDSFGKTRMALLKGKARLHLENKSYELSHKEARKIISLNIWGGDTNTNSFGANAVTEIHDIFFKRPKGNSINPGAEFAVNELCTLLIGQTMPNTTFFKIENVWTKNVGFEGITHPVKKRVYSIFLKKDNVQIDQIFKDFPEFKAEYPFDETRNKVFVQASMKVPGKNLHKILLEEEQSPLFTNFSENFFRSTFTLPADDRADNFMCTPDGNLVCIDNDQGLKRELYCTYEKSYKINLRSIVFLLPQMNEKISRCALNQILSMNCEERLIDWLKSLIRQNRIYESKLQKEHILTAEDYKGLSLPFKLSFERLITVYKALKGAHEFLKPYKDSAPEKVPTHWEVFDKMYPLLSMCYKRLLEKYQNSPLEVQQALFYFQNPSVDSILTPEEISSHKAYINSFSGDEIPLTIPELLQAFLEQIPVDKKIIEKVASIKEVTFLPIHNTNNGSRDILDAIADVTHIQSISYDQCTNLNKEGILGIFQQHTDIKHILGILPKISVGDLQEIIQYCWRNNIRIAFNLGKNNIITIQKETLNDDFYRILGNETIERKQKLKYAQVLIRLGVNLLYTSKHKRSYLHLLAEKNCPESLEFLLSMKIDQTPLLNLVPRDDILFTPLHIAAKAGCVENVKLLVKYGANLEDRDRQGLTPLFLAVRFNYPDVIDFLITSGADFKTRDGGRKTTLLLEAIEKHHNETFKKLVKLYPQGLHVGDENGFTPLHLAARTGTQHDIVKFIINEFNTIHLDIRNKHGNTPLHFAAMSGDFDSAGLFVQNGADKEITNAKEYMPIDLAIEYRNDKIVKFLLSLKPDSNDVPPKTLLSNALRNTFKDYINALTKKSAADEVYYLERLSDILFEEGDYQESAKFLAMAVSAISANHLEKNHATFLLKKLERGVAELLQKEVGVKIAAEHKGYLTEWYRSLKLMNEQLVTDLNNPKKLIEQALEEYTKKSEQLFLEIFNQAITLIKRNTPDYTLVALGKLASCERTMSSSIEFAILINEPTEETINYFKCVCKITQLLLIGLGQSPSERFIQISNPAKAGMRLENDTFHPMEFPELICTPESLAAFNAETPLGSTQFVTGSEKLYNQFLRGTQEVLSRKQNAFLKITPFGQQKREEVALNKIKRCLTNYSSYFHKFKDLDVKNPVDSFLLSTTEEVIYRLALYYNLSTKSSLAIIRNMMDVSLMSQVGGKQLIQAIRTLQKSKVQEELHDRQLVNIEPNSTEKVLSLLSAYEVVLSFHKETEKFIQNNNNMKTFQSVNFHSQDPILQGKCHELVLQYDKAKSFYESGLKQKFHKASCLFGIMKSQYYLGKLDGAYDIAIQLKNSKEYSHDWLGALAQKLNKTNEAIEYYEQAIEYLEKKSKKDFLEEICHYRLSLGVLYSEAWKPIKALEHLNKGALTIGGFYPDKHAKILLELGKISNLLGDVENANMQLTKACKVQSSLACAQPDLIMIEILFELGVSFLGKGDHDQALECLLEGKKLIEQDKIGSNPLHLSILSCLSQAYFLTGKQDEALKICQEAISLQVPPTNSQHLYGQLHLTKTLQTLGMYEKAIKVIEYARSVPIAKIDHPYAVLLSLEYGRLLDSLGSKLLSREALNEAHELLLKTFKDMTHPEVVTNLIDLAYHEILANNPEGAFKFLVEAKQKASLLKIKLNVEQEVNFKITYARAYQIENKLSQALDFYKEAIALYEGSYKISIKTYKMYMEFARLLKNADKRVDAITYYEKAYQVQQEIYKDQPHVDRVQTLESMAEVWQSLGDEETATKCLTMAKEYSEKLPKDNSNVKDTTPFNFQYRIQDQVFKNFKSTEIKTDLDSLLFVKDISSNTKRGKEEVE